ncbi:hypothetical protein CFAM422_011893 [Trichoderma lentiforme]|uniref:HNH nuclease domain-containing protein n=1 Tax=Trichoderma lentiforme TaxID=1567552 RepID=A0A9P4X4W9_9HYPO|nr:hypothetical protein CFAM422_011893 [Trichoderma lentiforme]
MSTHLFVDYQLRVVFQWYLAPGKSLEDKQELLRWVKNRPSFRKAAPIIRLEEIELRLELIDVIEVAYDESPCKAQRDEDGDFQFTALQLVYFLVIPMEHLRGIRATPMVPYIPYIKLEDYLLFMVLGIMPDDAIIDRGTTSLVSPDDTHTLSTDGDKPIDENADERAKCIARDGGVCVLTGAAYPEVCHIVPFEINATQAGLAYYREQFSHLTRLLGKESHAQVIDLLDSGLGCSDKAWNMLCLHPTLRDWWKKCLIGLKCLGITPFSHQMGYHTIQLQFYWMPRGHDISPQDGTQPDRDMIQEMLVIREQDDDPIRESQKSSSYRLQTGQVFSLNLPAEDAVKMRLMIDIQWANARLAAMSGLSGNWELLNRRPRVVNVDGWLEDKWQI